jgi:hypothetical protein
MTTEPIETEVVNQAIAVRPQMAVAQPMSVNDILAQVKLIQDVMRSVMHEGEHFGKVPGCGEKATLLQPGAQKLTMTFRLAPEYEIQETDLGREHKEYRVVCTLRNSSGGFVGQGVGCCSTMESKYRYRNGARKCPKCGKETIIKGKAEYGGGWLCYAKKGGCGEKWGDGATDIESQSIDRVEHDNPADYFNTVLKMAKKRAFVDATITATAASDIFTQDIGDGEDDPDHHTPPPPPPKRPTEAPRKEFPPPQRTIPKRDAPIGTISQRHRMIKELTTAGLAEAAWNWFVGKGMLKDGEVLDQLPLEFVPTTVAQMNEYKIAIERSQPSDNDGDLGPQEPPMEPANDEAWRSFPLPFPGQKGAIPKGTPLGEIKDGKYRWGLWKNYTVETEYNGKPLSQERIEANKAFRAALDMMGVAMEFK